MRRRSRSTCTSRALRPGAPSGQPAAASCLAADDGAEAVEQGAGEPGLDRRQRHPVGRRSAARRRRSSRARRQPCMPGPHRQRRRRGRRTSASLAGTRTQSSRQSLGRRGGGVVGLDAAGAGAALLPAAGPDDRCSQRASARSTHVHGGEPYGAHVSRLFRSRELPATWRRCGRCRSRPARVVGCERSPAGSKFGPV